MKETAALAVEEWLRDVDSCGIIGGGCSLFSRETGQSSWERRTDKGRNSPEGLRETP